MCRCWRVATSTCSRPETRGEIQRSWLGSALSKTRRDGPCGPPRLIFSRCTSSPTRRGLAPSPARATLLFFSENSKDAVSQKHVALVSDAKSSTYTRELGSISCARSAFFFKKKKIEAVSQKHVALVSDAKSSTYARELGSISCARSAFFWFGKKSRARQSVRNTRSTKKTSASVARAAFLMCGKHRRVPYTRDGLQRPLRHREDGDLFCGRERAAVRNFRGRRETGLHGSNPPRLDSSSTRAGQR